MATKKAGGTAKNLTGSNPQYLGVKLYDGERAMPGSVIVRQRGTRFVTGKNVKMGKDHTIYSLADGTVKYGKKRHARFDHTVIKKNTVDVIKAK